MGNIKEPVGVDFLIEGKPLTVKQKKEISTFIKADKIMLKRVKMNKSKSTLSKKTKGIILQS